MQQQRAQRTWQIPHPFCCSLSKNGQGDQEPAIRCNEGTVNHLWSSADPSTYLVDQSTSLAVAPNRATTGIVVWVLAVVLAGNPAP